MTRRVWKLKDDVRGGEVDGSGSYRRSVSGRVTN